MFTLFAPVSLLLAPIFGQVDRITSDCAGNEIERQTVTINECQLESFSNGPSRPFTYFCDNNKLGLKYYTRGVDNCDGEAELETILDSNGECVDGLIFSSTCADACEDKYSALGYNNGAAMYKYTGGCQQHFEYILDQSDGFTFSECSAKCLAHSDWCRSFTFGKGDIEGKCNLYGGICTPIIDNNDHSNWDMFTPILSTSSTWDFTGMCPQHFKYPLWQDKTGTFTVDECSQKCVDGSQWCRSFAYGKGENNNKWCNLYGGVCDYDVLPNRDSGWDFGVPILKDNNVDIIPLYTGRCQEHFQFGLLQDTSGTYTFDMCKEWAITNKYWCKSFTFGKGDNNRNYCNLYSGICTPQDNDFLDNDVFEVRDSLNNAKAICNSDKIFA